MSNKRDRGPATPSKNELTVEAKEAFAGIPKRESTGPASSHSSELDLTI